MIKGGTEEKQFTVSYQKVVRLDYHEKDFQWHRYVTAPILCNHTIGLLRTIKGSKPCGPKVI